MRLKMSSVARATLISMMLNLAIASSIHATSGGAINRETAYALGLLILVVLGLAAYLVVVIIRPENF